MPPSELCLVIWRSAPQDAIRGGAARALAQSLGRPILACIGDAPNDLTMLRAADYGFRTGDCDISLRDLPFLPAAPSGEGSVASAISQLRRLL